MRSESPSFAEETASNMLNELQSWWEIPAVAQYVSLFREAFNLPEIEIEELENGLIEDTIKGPNEWLQNLVIAFLKSILGPRVNPNTWELHLQKLIRKRWCLSPFADKENPFAEDISFHQLKLRSKVEIIYCFCLYRLDGNDTAELMKSMDAEALRVQKLGLDDAGSTYWYFYGTRLYKEEAIEEKKTWNEEWNEQKRKSMAKKRGRGRPRKSKITEENNVEDDLKNDKFMNVSEKSRWSVVCDTLEEWVNFAEKFKSSKSKNEKSLFQIIQENFLPTLTNIYEEKERKLQQKIKELLPVREKIVTRRETRKLRGDTGGDINYALLNGYESDEEYKGAMDDYQMPVVKDRAQRLEERNKRVSEAGNTPSSKKHRRNEETGDSSSSDASSNADSEDSEFDVMAQMIKLLSSVKLHKDAWPFLHPVSEIQAPGYYEIIKDPIDLSTIESRLHKGDYETVGDLDEDFSKMVSNCELYNGENHPYSKMAQALRTMFRQEIAILLEKMEALQGSSNRDSEESNDSQYHSSSSSSSSSSQPSESPVVESKEHKRGRKKKKKHNTEALDLLAQASDDALKEDFVNSPSPPQKKSPVPQEIRPAPPVYHVPSANMPSNAASSSSPSSVKAPVPVTVSNFITVTSSSPQRAIKSKPVIIRAKPSETKKASPVQNVITTSLNTMPNNVSNVNQSANVNQSYSPKTLPVVLPISSPDQSELRIQNNSMPAATMQSIQNNSMAAATMQSIQNNSMPAATMQSIQNNSMPAATMQSNMCMPNPNRLPVMQQVMIPAGTQVQNSGQYIFASPQNTFRILNKEQTVQFQNSVGQLNQGFVKVVPQIISSSPVMQVSQDGMQRLQFQTLSPNSTQAFAQVAQNPQFVNIPYVVSNQNTIVNSSAPSTVSFQSFQMPSRQLQISEQGNG